MDAKFSIETHRYRNGETPILVVNLPRLTQHGCAIISQMGHGAVFWHLPDGTIDRMAPFAAGHYRPDYDLIPISLPPEVAYWGKAEDVDPLIERMRTNSSQSLGFLVYERNPNGIVVLGRVTVPGKDDYAGFHLLTWKDLKYWQYRRIGCPIWRPCSAVTTSEGV